MNTKNWFTKHKIDNVSGLDPHRLMERYPNHTLNDLTAEYRHAKFRSRQSGLGYLWVRIGDITLHVRDECEECGKYTIHLPYHLRWLYAVLADYGILAQEGTLCYLCSANVEENSDEFIMERHKYTITLNEEFIPYTVHEVHLTWGQAWREYIVGSRLINGQYVVEFETSANLDEESKKWRGEIADNKYTGVPEVKLYL